MAIATGSKAYFVNVDGGGTFHCQFNPKELKLEDTASWKQSDEQGNAKPTLTYEKGQPAVLSMDLVFDTTDTGGSVKGRVDALRAFLANSITEKDEGGSSSRPPHVDFHWNDFVFKGVIEKISVSILMFKADGTPLRAKATVTMKERAEAAGGSTGAGNSVTLSSAGTIFVGAGVSARTTTVKPNQTMSQVAAENNTDVRTIAKANPQFENPMEMNAGANLVIPGAELADVMANQALGESPANFAPVGDIDPFGGDSADGGFDVGNILPGEHGDLSADFSTSALGGAVDDAADRAREITDQAHGQVNEAINDAQRRAHEVLGTPDFDDMF